jgi:hypothetical protein
MTQDQFQRARKIFRRQMSFVAVILCLSVIFLISRPSFIGYFRSRDALALLFIFVVWIGYAIAVMLTAWLLGRHHRFVCPTCGRSLVLQLDSVQKTGKCSACHSEVIYAA